MFWKASVEIQQTFSEFVRIWSSWAHLESLSSEWSLNFCKGLISKIEILTALAASCGAVTSSAVRCSDRTLEWVRRWPCRTCARRASARAPGRPSRAFRRAERRFRRQRVRRRGFGRDTYAKIKSKFESKIE